VYFKSKKEKSYVELVSKGCRAPELEGAVAVKEVHNINMATVVECFQNDLECVP